MDHIDRKYLSPFSGSNSSIKRKISQLTRKEKHEFINKYGPLSPTKGISSECQSNAKGSSIIKYFILDPTSKQAHYWLFTVAVAAIYFCWSVSLRVAYGTIQELWWLWMIFDTIFYSVYFADLFIQMRTSYLHDGILEQDLIKLKLFYMQSIYFKIDILSLLPLNLVYGSIFWTTSPPVLHCTKLVKIYRVWQFYIRSESRSHCPNMCRVLFLVHNLLMIIHWNACWYYLLSNWIGMGSDSWVYPAWNSTYNREWGYISRQYLYSFYWSTLTLTTIGELPEPRSNLEYLFMTLEYLIGILMFATVVGNIGSIIENTQKNRTKFQTKMDNIKKYMKANKISDDLQERVIKWFDYQWSYGNSVEEHVLDNLPDKLKAEIGMHVYFKTLKKVDFFEECEQGLLWEIVLRLRTQVYSPGEYVCKKGDVGREMYIVNSGKLEVLVEEDGMVLKQLTHGEYFGEISVLNLGMGKSHRRRTAFVRSLGYTSLLCLTQANLFEVLKDYPNAKQKLMEKSRNELQNDAKYNQDEVLKETTIPTILTEDECDSIPDSTDLLNRPPLEVTSMADQVTNLSERLLKIEDLIHTVLAEVQKNSTSKSTIAGSSTLFEIKERVRKLSSQM